MSLSNITLHEGYIPAYQMSGSPFMTSSLISAGTMHTHQFAQATRFFTVTNKGTTATDAIQVACTARGFSTSNYIELEAGDSFKEEIRVITLFVSCTVGTNVKYNMVGGLTNIPRNNFLTVTASNGHDGVG